MSNKYYHTKNSVVEYIQLSKDVNGQNLIERLKEFLPQKSTLLEIGSGPGSDWEILNTNYTITGSDNSQEFLNHLYTKYPKGKFLELDASTLNIDKKFDGIYSNKVLHHLNNDELSSSIKNQFKVLNNNGVICHSFWTGEGSEIFKGMFVNYHTKKTVKAFFENHFDILLLESYKEFDEDDSFFLVAKKKKLN